MSRTRFDTVEDVAAWRLCMGCGACVSACRHGGVRLVDVREQGFRPVIDSDKCEGCGECVSVCPGVGLGHDSFGDKVLVEEERGWGPILEVWEGYARDEEVRFKGSSGGVATALSLFALASERAGGVLQIRAEQVNPLRNVTVLSASKEDVMSAVGSRYSPAAPCVGLSGLDGGGVERCVFVGKPCDVAAVRKMERVRPEVIEKIALTISIFCAGTPATLGTERVLEKLGVRADEVSEFRYRGCGWPGEAIALLKGRAGQSVSMSYEQSWGEILSRCGQFRCRLCPDGTGEFADVSCGDPWYKEVEPGDAGQSLVLVRTEAGREFLHAAMSAGCVDLKRVASEVLARSQPALLNKRGSLWGRFLALRLLGAAVPRYVGFSLFSNWLGFSLMGKVRSLAGTLRRGLSRKWYKRLARVDVADMASDGAGEPKAGGKMVSTVRGEA